MAIKEVKGKSGSKKETSKKPAKPAPSASKDEQIGFHKGALSTLAKEREEMLKILTIVEQLMQMHVSALKELGVDLEKIAKQAAAKGKGGKSASLEKQLK